MEDWALIRGLAAEGIPKAQIAVRLGISRNTVARAVASDEPPKYSRPPVEETTFTVFAPRVRVLLAEFPDMPASVIAERVGWTGSSSWFRENVAKLRPEQQRADPADRLVWSPGDAAQCDLWFPPQRIPLEDGTKALLPVLVMVAAYSRFINALMIPTRQTPDLLLGMWSLIRSFGRVPRRLIWDNESGIGRRGRLAAGVGEFCGTLATRLHQLKAYDPESKGIVERRNGFFETSFMPGRKFVSPADFNGQFTEWLDDANGRLVRTVKARPADLVQADREAMLALPPVPPVVGWSSQIRLGRDYYVRVDTNDLLRRPRPHRPTREHRRRSRPGDRPPGPPGDRGARQGLGSPRDGHRPGSSRPSAPVTRRVQAAPQPRGRERPGPGPGDYDRAFGLDNQEGVA